MRDSCGPFIPGMELHIEGAHGQPLTGHTFAAKDLFDVAGVPTGGGNPDWARQNPIPTQHAWAVERLLSAGATLVGKTVTCEVSLGILGDNPFFGTPENPAAPGHVPGGSSSGSAAAVAGRRVDTAIGTDTGGSVRVPASFCGLYGIRPTHGRLNLRGMMAQAPSSDTLGWFAHDAELFSSVSQVMLETTLPDTTPSDLIIAHDAFGIADEEVAKSLQPAVDALRRIIPNSRHDTLAPPGLSVWARAQRTIQPWEGWQTFRKWIEHDNPRMAFSVAKSLALAANIADTDLQWARLMRDDARGRIRTLLEADTILCLPTTPFPAPPLNLTIAEQTSLRNRIACLCSPGGLTGICQVSIPVTAVHDRPIGLSLMGRPGNDELLIRTALQLSKELEIP